MLGRLFREARFRRRRAHFGQHIESASVRTHSVLPAQLICITSTAAQPHSSHAIGMLQENTLQSALASLLRSQKEHIVALQHAIAQNHVANNVPLPPDLHACNGQAHGDPHAKAK